MISLLSSLFLLAANPRESMGHEISKFGWPSIKRKAGRQGKDRQLYFRQRHLNVYNSSRQPLPTAQLHNEMDSVKDSFFFQTLYEQDQ